LDFFLFIVEFCFPRVLQENKEFEWTHCE